MAVNLYALAIIGGYLIGSIPFGLLMGFVKGVDIRDHGSGNIGATNAARAIGWKWFPLVLLLDAAKGFAPAFFFLHWPAETSPALPLLAASGSLLGHFFSLYLKFKGGKGVATGLGVVLAITGTPISDWPLPAFCALGVFAIITGLTRYVALGSIFAVLTLPVFYFLMTQPDTFKMRWFAYLLFLCVVAVLVVIKHRNNISRMLAGTESRIGERADTTDGASA
ncbi:MAG: glycerol-3-phosphate 1-O-acyltransferase PlsY [Planctomycetes bacterium]|nr:glycerol-3-phosphate 1-O-acyltransferase PlsY [Planctomycetota bacterium]